MAAGFNGARLHQKVFEERFLYHADRLGYLVWGEFGDWGCQPRRPDRRQPAADGAGYVTQWLEAVERDYSHPSHRRLVPAQRDLAAADRPHHRARRRHPRRCSWPRRRPTRTRPVLDTSGYAHRVPETDVYDSHDYEQDPATFGQPMAGLADGKPYVNPARSRRHADRSVPYRGQPYFVSEFGGIWWNPDATAGRGAIPGATASAPRAEEEFYARFEGLVDVAAGRPADVRLLLHPADRRLPGTERHLSLRPYEQAGRRPDPRGPATSGRHRADRRGMPSRTVALIAL